MDNHSGELKQSQPSWSRRLARSVLLRAAKDKDPSGMEEWCDIVGIPFDEFVKAVAYIASRGETQQKVLINRLRKRL